MIECIQHAGLYLLKPVAEINLTISQTRSQRNDIDEKSDQRLNIRMATASDIGPHHQVLLMSLAVHQQLKTRQ